MTNEEKEALIARGWTPPVAVDPDLAEATILYNRHHASFEGLEETLFTAIKRGRELERAVMGNPIPEQIQEVKPTVAVDPDIAEAWDLVGWRGWSDNHELVLSAIKRGRALAAEAKPRLVWVKHDGSTICPVDPNSYVWIKRGNPSYVQTTTCYADAVGWYLVTHYAVITPPEDK